jgi:hypothetical protein
MLKDGAIMKNPKITQRHVLSVLIIAVFIGWAAVPALAADPLPSWNDGEAKQSIIEFVSTVSKQGSSDFVPVEERIATFDNDGTLWAEQPMYFQVLFAIDRVKALAPQHPEWKEKEPFASLLKGDVKGAMADGMKSVVEIVMATHAGMTTAEFETIVNDWIATARHPTTKRPYTEMVYQPMLEVLAYLRANGFKTFIVSGGGIEFMRPWVEKVYGIPPEQVIGSSIKVKFECATARRFWSVCPRSTSTTIRKASRLPSTSKLAGGPLPRSATPTATCRCCNGPPPGRGHGSRSTSTTPMPSANGPTTESPALAASTRASTKRRKTAGRSWT